MWKFQDFSVIKILRQIDFGEFRGSKVAVVFFYKLRGSEFCQFDKFQHPKSAKNS